MIEDLEIIDCRHHLWNLTANSYPWLTDKIGTRVGGDCAERAGTPEREKGLGEWAARKRVTKGVPGVWEVGAPTT